jgi:hypothetical protein
MEARTCMQLCRPVPTLGFKPRVILKQQVEGSICVEDMGVCAVRLNGQRLDDGLNMRVFTAAQTHNSFPNMISSILNDGHHRLLQTPIQ